jgi:hypothetical protein
MKGISFFIVTRMKIPFVQGVMEEMPDCGVSKLQNIGFVVWNSGKRQHST